MFKKFFLIFIGFLITLFVYNNSSNYSIKELINLDPSNYNISLSLLIISILCYALGVLARAIRLLYLNNNSV